MALDNERLSKIIKEVLQDRYFQQSFTSEKTRDLVSYAIDILHAFAGLEEPKNPRGAYAIVGMLAWRLAEAVYLYLHTEDNPPDNGATLYKITDLTEFIEIAKKIRDFIKGLESSDFAACEHTETADPTCQQCKKKTEANKLKESLLDDVRFTMKVRHVHAAVIRLAELEPVAYGAEVVNIISRDASSITIAKNYSKIKVTFDAA